MTIGTIAVSSAAGTNSTPESRMTAICAALVREGVTFVVTESMSPADGAIGYTITLNGGF